MVSPLSFPLPDGLAEEDLRILVSPEMWERDPQQAAILALRRSGRFDEAAYLARYPDVRESGMDAIEHYVKYGVKEKRKSHTVQDTTHGLSDGKASATKSKLLIDKERQVKELTEENELLLQQLQVVQEELEKCHYKIKGYENSYKN